MASDFLLEAMQNLSGNLFPAPPFDLLPQTEDSAPIAPELSSTRSCRNERRSRPHPTQALKCPRCDSLNTKFCYYNNYNLSQPRHFCKSCRRYWTNGGVLRNVPVGGGCRKNKKSSVKKPPQLCKSNENPVTLVNFHNSTSSSPSSSSSSSILPDGELRSVVEYNDMRRLNQGLEVCSTVPFNDYSSIASATVGLEELCVNPQATIQSPVELQDITSMSANPMLSTPTFNAMRLADLQWKIQKQNYSDESSTTSALQYGVNASIIDEMNPFDMQGNTYNFEPLLEDWNHLNGDAKMQQNSWSEQHPVYLP